MFPIGQVIASRFRVEECVGQGAMGTVFAATDGVLGRKVAMKLLKPELAGDAKFLERFKREARIVAQLSLNPHVVTIYDVGETEDGIPFLVTEFLTGHPLSQEVTSPYRPARSWLLDVGLRICLALVDAHERGVVHRDLKPANVFVVRTGVVPLFVKVLDFGLSRSDDTPLPSEHATLPGTIQGSPRYMAPEVISGENATASSEIYSLGVLLYEFATGAFPYDAQTASECLRAHLMAKPLPLPKEEVPLPDEFQRLILMMLNKDPAKRPSARTCRQELSLTRSAQRSSAD